MAETDLHDGYATPQDILNDSDLSRAQKVDTLKSWRDTIERLHRSNPIELPQHTDLLARLDDALAEVSGEEGRR